MRVDTATSRLLCTVDRTIEVSSLDPSLRKGLARCRWRQVKGREHENGFGNARRPAHFICPIGRKAALKRPHSKRFANAGAPDAARQLLECGRFSAAFALDPEKASDFSLLR